MKKILIIFFLFFTILMVPLFSLAQDNVDTQIRDEIFEARVEKVLEQKEIKREDSSQAWQQNILLRGLEGKWKNRVITYKGISDLDVVSNNTYRAGDRVLVQYSSSPDGSEQYYIIDYVRRNYLYALAVIFVAVIVLVGGKKGFKAILSLALTFVVILKFILPQILAGVNPLLVGLIGSLAILTIIIYLTEGWNQKSHLAMISVFISLFLTLLLAWLFTYLTHLTGFAQEESAFLISATKTAINFKGLLLCGILIGTVGVLDDIIIGQIEAVKQIKEVNPNLKKGQIFKAAFKIGNTHLGAIVNTLFLTYAGASLSLLLLFTVKQEPFLNFSQVLNNELIATEIVRTLIGSIGIALSMPFSTWLATMWLKAKRD
ncbi:MAG: YibE/F family protein [Planctomycetes bacterium]|nr:YibE/F family protein [Planctomycetota bacterium]